MPMPAAASTAPDVPAAVSPRRRSKKVAVTFFRDLVGSLRNSVVAITRSGEVVHLNDDARRTLGLRPDDDLVGRHYTDALASAPDIVRVFDAAFDLNHLPNRAELRVKATSKVIGYTVCLVRTPEGRVSGAALLFKDLTRVEQLEERERLRDRLAALGEMAAAIAHEVKNPLAGIEVMAGLLKRRVPDSPEAQELLGDIINEAKMANAIVLEVLEFVRPIRLEVERVSIASTVDNAVHMAESLAPRGATAVVLDLPAALPAIDGDAHQLCQLFTNLLTNAFEALDGDGQIVVSARHVPRADDAFAPEGSLVVEVADDGPGVPLDVRDRIFSPFFTTKARGSGLGLAIVKKIVDAHDGRLDLESRPEGGTVFRVMLPVAVDREVVGPYAITA
jgi:signal transduction histidine kinase